MRASWVVTIGIGGLAVLVAVTFVLSYSIAVERLGGRRIYARMAARTALLAWMSAFALLAGRGVLANTTLRPPPLALAMLAFVGAGIALGMSEVGTKFVQGWPIGWLILGQAFRFPLELVMHQAAREGVMPMEMSLAGYNFDILTGITAIGLGVQSLRKPNRHLILTWNILGSLLLANILTVAVLASPIFRAFGPEPHVNWFITQFPFVWLGAVLVSAAVFGHVIIFRALRAWSLALRAPSSSPPSSS